jgi:hypothetical protein
MDINESLIWNEEEEIFEIIVRSTDQNNYKQMVTIGRNLIYSSDFQKCLF